MTPQAMATALRALGWVCVPPAAKKPPEPAVGQVWVSADGHLRPHVKKVHHDGAVHYAIDDIHYYISASDWAEWVRKSEARPV